jgi:hypothetical protein
MVSVVEEVSYSTYLQNGGKSECSNYRGMLPLQFEML